MTKYDYIAIAALVALMAWTAAEKFPRDKLLSAWGGIVSFFARPSALGGIVFILALAIVGLFYVKWSPYYAKAFVAAQDHTLGASIVSGNLPAAPDVSLQAGFAYSIAYFKEIWQALLLGLAVGAGIAVLLPRARLSQFFAGWKGSLRVRVLTAGKRSRFYFRNFYRCARGTPRSLMKSGALFPFDGQSRN